MSYKYFLLAGPLVAARHKLFIRTKLDQRLQSISIYFLGDYETSCQRHSPNPVTCKQYHGLVTQLLILLHCTQVMGSKCAKRMCRPHFFNNLVRFPADSRKKGPTK